MLVGLLPAPWSDIGSAKAISDVDSFLLATSIHQTTTKHKNETSQTTKRPTACPQRGEGSQTVPPPHTSARIAEPCRLFLAAATTTFDYLLESTPMGICSSCLGGRRASESEQSDSSHLLGDQYQPNYGATSGPHNAPQPDPEELRRQRETLERICAETSEQLIPVSQPNLIPEVTEQPPKNDEYAHLFNERFRSIRDRPASANADNDGDETAWLENAVGSPEEDELDQIKPAKGRLTIQFGAR